MALPTGTYYYSNGVTIGIYAKKSGVWTKIQDYVVATDGGSYSTPGARTYSVSVNDTFQLGSGVQAFGLAITGVEIGSATLTGFTHAKWQAQGSSGGSRSATPNSEQSTVTVRPI